MDTQRKQHGASATAAPHHHMAERQLYSGWATQPPTRSAPAAQENQRIRELLGWRLLQAYEFS